MTLEQLRIFVAVAEREHVTQAARALNLTQSAVSGAVSALEGRHGVHLFDRVGRGVVLNETGRAFLAEARAVLARAAAAEAALDDMAALRRGRLAIHASQTIASYWLPTRLVAFHAAHPGVAVEMKVGNTREVADAVLAGSAELGFVEGAIDEPALSDQVVGEDELVVLTTPGHSWAHARALEASDLAASPWVLREPGSGTRSTLEAHLAAAGVDPEALEVVMSLPSNEAVLAAAQAGAGATALSRSVAEAAILTGRLVVAPAILAPRRFHLLRHKERYRSRAGDAFVGLAEAP
ncbi:MAG: LysR family transcriptional regulator [Caulobacteraceae bacterium]|nr:LysR family transcriptional regulator [Caulobacter sp.]